MYWLVSLAVVMFGLMFFANERYQKDMGSGVFQAMLYNLLGCIASFPILLALNNFKIEYTHFTLICAIATCVNSLLFTLCSLKALEKVNLSVFSMLSMLGGMLLPAVVGVVFYSEKLTWGLGACIIFIVASLLLLIDRQGESKKGAFFIYAGVFIFNGLSGVISKIYTDSTCPKASSMGFSLLTAIVVFACCLVVLLFVWKNRVKTTNKALIGGLIAGPLSKIANYFLLIALAVLPASVNYSFVTGGTIIVSTVIAYFTPCKPKKREWLAVGLAFIGIICLTTF